MVVLYVSFEESSPEHTIKLDVASGALTVQAALQRFALEYAAGTGVALQASDAQLQTEEGVLLSPNALLPCGLASGSDLFVTRSPPAATTRPAAAKVFAKEGSAIAASQAKAGEHSYYYSVGKNKGLPEELAAANSAAPTPKAVQTPSASALAPPWAVVKAAPTMRENTISSYSMLDDGDRVKVHIPLAGASTLEQGAVTVDFRDRSFDLRVLTGGQCLRLHMPILLEEIKQQECFVKARQGKLILHLIKRDATKGWYELRKTKGVGDTEFAKIVPDDGESVLFTL